MALLEINEMFEHITYHNVIRDDEVKIPSEAQGI